jgi:hypothetical protein
MAPIHLREKTNNKKEKILALLSEGKFSVKDIARIVQTTEANVYKEKSRAKGLFIRQKTRSDEMVMVAGEPNNLTLPWQRLNPEGNHFQYLDIKNLDSEGIKKLYSEFKAGKKPDAIIAEHGFHPEVVEIEYHRFLKMNERDIDAFQNMIISYIIKHQSENTKLLLEKYKKNGFLTHYELSELFALKVKDDFEREVDRWGFDTTAHLPRGWSRIKCKLCNQNELGIILNPSVDIGKLIFEQFNDYVCDVCKIHNDHDIYTSKY